MSRAIDGDILEKKLKDAINMCVSIDTSGLSELKAVLEDVEEMPTIEPERKKGTWIEYDNSHCECPFCHEEWSYFNNEVEYFNYCPNCGAEMTEGEG